MELFSQDNLSHQLGPTINLCLHMVPAYPTLLPVPLSSKRKTRGKRAQGKTKQRKRQKSETDTDDDDDVVGSNVGANMPRPNRL
jgi:hypothetical protein